MTYDWQMPQCAVRGSQFHTCWYMNQFVRHMNMLEYFVSQEETQVSLTSVININILDVYFELAVIFGMSPRPSLQFEVALGSLNVSRPCAISNLSQLS